MIFVFSQEFVRNKQQRRPTFDVVTWVLFIFIPSAWAWPSENDVQFTDLCTLHNCVNQICNVVQHLFQPSKVGHDYVHALSLCEYRMTLVSNIQLIFSCCTLLKQTQFHKQWTWHDNEVFKRKRNYIWNLGRGWPLVLKTDSRLAGKCVFPMFHSLNVKCYNCNQRHYTHLNLQYFHNNLINIIISYHIINNIIKSVVCPWKP